jgi:4'-phosphopantetheinyl transferase
MTQLHATTWNTPPHDLVLTATAVHLWRIDLAGLVAQAERLAETLAPDELARAARFRFARDRLRFIAGRAALRAILARYLGVAPREVAFVYGAHGKPALTPGPPLPSQRGRGPGGEAQIQFNVAHSAELALVAVARGRAVGVDVEMLRPLPELAPMIDKVCTPRERVALRALPDAERPAAFFNLWTRKEAVLKARGDGLGMALDRVEVALGEPARLLRLDGDPQAAQRWSLRALAPAPGYVAALAVEGDGWSLVPIQTNLIFAP